MEVGHASVQWLRPLANPRSGSRLISASQVCLCVPVGLTHGEAGAGGSQRGGTLSGTPTSLLLLVFLHTVIKRAGGEEMGERLERGALHVGEVEGLAGLFYLLQIR